MNTRNASQSIPYLFLTAALVLGMLANNGCSNNNWFTQRKNNLENQIETAAQAQRDGHSIWLTSFDFANQRAKSENKLVMAHFTGSDWCTWCIKLEEEVFETVEFEQWSSQYAIPVKLDYPKTTKLERELRQQNELVLQRYAKHVKGYPTVLFLDERGEVVAKMGYLKGGPEKWIAKVEEKLGWQAE